MTRYNYTSRTLQAPASEFLGCASSTYTLLQNENLQKGERYCGSPSPPPAQCINETKGKQRRRLTSYPRLNAEARYVGRRLVWHQWDNVRCACVFADECRKSHQDVLVYCYWVP